MGTSVRELGSNKREVDGVEVDDYPYKRPYLQGGQSGPYFGLGKV